MIKEGVEGMAIILDKCGQIKAPPKRGSFT
jgi:hypothetical protein